MNKSRLLGAVCACATALVFSTSANAAVINTLNGVEYEWLAQTETVGLSRSQVELRLADPNDVLYGYKYASRALVEDLFYSYSSFSGQSGWWGSEEVVLEMTKFFEDFGVTFHTPGDGVDSFFTSVDGVNVAFDGYGSFSAMYGNKDECRDGKSCYARIGFYTDTLGNITAINKDRKYGWWDTYSDPVITSITDTNDVLGSLLVKTTAVPVPAAAWLFGSGLLGLVGVARRKKV